MNTLFQTARVPDLSPRVDSQKVEFRRQPENEECAALEISINTSSASVNHLEVHELTVVAAM